MTVWPLITARDMRDRYGEGPPDERCGVCRHLQPTALLPRPGPKAHNVSQFTTFVCQASRVRSPWSVLYPSCARFVRA